MKVILLAIVVALPTGLLAQNAIPQRDHTSCQIELFAQFGKEQTWASNHRADHAGCSACDRISNSRWYQSCGSRRQCDPS